MNEEQRLNAMVGVQMILASIEGDPLRPELKDTPKRMVNSLEEMLSGYSCDIESLFKTFEDDATDQIVAVTNIQFTSICEHHLLPWQGIAHVAYLPVKRVIGVSKIGRLVLAYAHRLQLQERMTKQIAYTMMKELEPQGVAVVTIGEHSCMRCRGVNLPTAQLRCSEMLGEFRVDRALRMEVLSILGLNSNP